MTKLDISIEIEGVMTKVGSITGKSAGDSRFRYDPEYLESGSAMPISISLPLQSKAFSASRTASFFEGLLPEGFTRRSVAQWMHVDEGDYLSILHGLGRECIGAVCVTSEGDTYEASYEPVTSEQVRALAAEGATKSAELVTKSHLSLTGASGKAGLYYDRRSGKWYLPHGLAPSTHIVKQSHVRFDNIVLNEQLTLMTARNLGIKTTESFIINTGKGGEDEVLLACERFDRLLGYDDEMISGLPRPCRVHQEDMCQAMGIPASAKYELENEGHLKRMFGILREYSEDPVRDEIRLWDLIVFDCLTGNTDAHIKNFSLLYSPDLESIRLAPAYDLVITAIYDESTREMAFSIGGACSLDEIDRDCFRRAASEAGLGEKMAMRRLRNMAGKFRQALHKAAEELSASGYTGAPDLESRILSSSPGMHLL